MKVKKDTKKTSKKVATTSLIGNDVVGRFASFKEEEQRDIVVTILNELSDKEKSLIIEQSQMNINQTMMDVLGEIVADIVRAMYSNKNKIALEAAKKVFETFKLARDNMSKKGLTEKKPKKTTSPESLPLEDPVEVFEESEDDEDVVLSFSDDEEEDEVAAIKSDFVGDEFIDMSDLFGNAKNNLAVKEEKSAGLVNGQCSKCKTKNSDDALFCRYCSKQLIEKSKITVSLNDDNDAILGIFCPNEKCSLFIKIKKVSSDKNDRYCSKCQSPLIRLLMEPVVEIKDKIDWLGLIGNIFSFFKKEKK